jgi:hypothetical protein
MLQARKPVMETPPETILDERVLLLVIGLAVLKH